MTFCILCLTITIVNSSLIVLASNVSVISWLLISVMNQWVIFQPYFTPDFTSNQPTRHVLSGSEHWLRSEIALTISTSYDPHDHPQDIPVNSTIGLLIVDETSSQAEISFKFLLDNVPKDKDPFPNHSSLKPACSLRKFESTSSDIILINTLSNNLQQQTAK